MHTAVPLFERNLLIVDDVAEVKPSRAPLLVDVGVVRAKFVELVSR